MKTGFRILPLEPAQFAAVMQQPAPDMRWLRVDHQPGYPCRVSLRDAAVGERVLALQYTHHDVDTPYRSSGPIFIRERARAFYPEVNEVPEMLRNRELSLRGYDQDGMMIVAATTTGTQLEEALKEMFCDTTVGYVHIHNAAPGCFNCTAQRA